MFKFFPSSPHDLSRDNWLMEPTSGPNPNSPRHAALTRLELRLLNEFQRDLPLTARPYLAMAERLGCSEAAVLDGLQRLCAAGMISRVGVILQPKRVGISTLAAMQVPQERLDEVADLVNGFQEVNHNYEREHRFNLWFVLTAASQERLQEVVGEIERRSGIPVCIMPMEREFHIDLGFRIHG